MSVPLNRPLAKEFELEVGTTRRLLERVPAERLDWQPHSRSMTLGRLASHIVEVVRYGSLVIESESLDSTRRTQGPLSLESTSAILERLDSYSAAFLDALAGASDEHLLSPWRYCKGERVIFETLRLHALRTFVLNHWYHHRGQLTVYLRQLDVALPQVYGPSADDSGGY